MTRKSGLKMCCMNDSLKTPASLRESVTDMIRLKIQKFKALNSNLS